MQARSAARGLPGAPARRSLPIARTVKERRGRTRNDAGRPAVVHGRSRPGHSIPAGWGWPCSLKECACRSGTLRCSHDRCKRSAHRPHAGVRWNQPPGAGDIRRDGDSSPALFHCRQPLGIRRIQRAGSPGSLRRSEALQREGRNGPRLLDHDRPRAAHDPAALHRPQAAQRRGPGAPGGTRRAHLSWRVASSGI